MGGGSTINGMLYVRGNRADFDFWNASSWTYSRVLPFFKKSENNRDPAIAADTEYHATGGPLSVKFPERRNRYVGLVTEAFAELGFETVDFNGRNQFGQGVFQLTVDGNRRDSTNSAFLDPVRDERPNLHIVTQAVATQVLFEDVGGRTRATGVRFLDKQGKERTVLAGREVVLSAGALGTPQLLMLSGVGPAEHLRQLHIPVRLDLPVGEQLQDHVFVKVMSFRVSSATQPACPRLQRQLQDYLQQLQERPPFEPRTSFGAFRRSEAQPRGDARPYIEYLPSVVDEAEAPATDNCNAADATCSVNQTLNIYMELLHPRSRGRVLMRSADPLRQPAIHLGMLEDAEDVRITVEGMRWIAQGLAGSDALRRSGARMDPIAAAAPEPCRRYDPTAANDDRFWRCLALATANSGYHYVGTCRIGDVVDEQLRVKGTDGLRLADASVIPLSPSGNSYAPTVMVAERAACMVRREHDAAFTPPLGESC